MNNAAIISNYTNFSNQKPKNQVSIYNNHQNYNQNAININNKKDIPPNYHNS